MTLLCLIVERIAHAVSDHVIVGHSIAVEKQRLIVGYPIEGAYEDHEIVRTGRIGARQSGCLIGVGKKGSDLGLRGNGLKGIRGDALRDQSGRSVGEKEGVLKAVLLTIEMLFFDGMLSVVA